MKNYEKIMSEMTLEKFAQLMTSEHSLCQRCPIDEKCRQLWKKIDEDDEPEIDICIMGSDKIFEEWLRQDIDAPIKIRGEKYFDTLPDGFVYAERQGN